MSESSPPSADTDDLDPLAVANRLRPVLLHVSRHLRREIDSLGVTPGQLSLLGAIRDLPGIGVSELAARERTSAPTMCAHIDRLETGGLVARARAEGPDRRRVGLTVTDEGLRVLLAARSRRTAWLATRLRSLSPEQLRLVAEAIEPLDLLSDALPRSAALPRRSRRERVAMSVAAQLSPARTFASVRRHRNYRLWFTGQVVSVTGTWVQSVAQAWLVLQLTHSAGAVGVLAACQFGPFAVLGLLGGVISDRLDMRRTLIATQAASMLCAAVLAVLALTHLAAVWQVDALAAVNGLVMVLDTPSRQAFTMQMVGRRELPNAVALNSSLFNASRIMGPGLGGLIIATAGVGLCFVINAASYLAVLAALLLMRPADLHPVVREQRRPSMLRGLRDGLAYAWTTPPVLLVLAVMLVIATVSINFNVLLPVLTANTLHSGPEVFGALSAGFGAGALVGALLSATLGRASWPVLLGGATTMGVSELLLAPQRSLLPTLLILAVTGVAFSLFTSNSNSTLQLHVPDHLRGRVLSLYAYVFFGTAPLGGVLTGWLSQRGGTDLAFLVAGGTATLAAVGGILVWRYGLTERRQGSRSAPDEAAAAVPPAG